MKKQKIKYTERQIEATESLAEDLCLFDEEQDYLETALRCWPHVYKDVVITKEDRENLEVMKEHVRAAALFLKKANTIQRKVMAHLDQTLSKMSMLD